MIDETLKKIEKSSESTQELGESQPSEISKKSKLKIVATVLLALLILSAVSFYIITWIFEKNSVAVSNEITPYKEISIPSPVPTMTDSVTFEILRGSNRESSLLMVENVDLPLDKEEACKVAREANDTINCVTYLKDYDVCPEEVDTRIIHNKVVEITYYISVYESTEYGNIWRIGWSQKDPYPDGCELDISEDFNDRGYPNIECVCTG